MKRLLNNKKLAVFAFALVAFTFGNIAIAQQQMPGQQPQQPVKEDFKKEELQSFIKANQKVVAIQRASEEEMVKVIEKEGFTIQRFNEIAESQQDPEKKVEADEKELSSFNSAAEKITGMGKDIDGKMQESIKKEGIDLETYQEIIYAYQNSEKVKKEVDELLPKQEEPQQQPQQEQQ